MPPPPAAVKCVCAEAPWTRQRAGSPAGTTAGTERASLARIRRGDTPLAQPITAPNPCRPIPQHDDRQPSIGAPGITAAVAPFALRVEAVLPFDRPHHASILQFACDVVALRIDIGTDVMRDLSGGVAEPHPFVERRRTEPGAPSVIQRVATPEADMVPVARATADRLFECQILLAAEQEQVAHRRFVIGPAQYGGGHDSHAAHEGDRVGGKPSGRGHPPHHFGIAAHQCDIDRITRVAVRCQRDTIGVRAGRVMPEVKLR